ncbi:hypothetical protein [Methylobacterium sp. J-068]|uniref:hypothetical protein n=1 Tax=Methylobacterium sp. J-068 TaxID=2836649 RepID=UPI001FB883D4|nr:hypothetical protein [Methylobacterium sp. J-068]MCJ2036015.1 hypothetical protein [Methylobacterium sp. J-068]
MTIGKFVYTRLTGEEQAYLGRAMERADGRNESDDLYCGLANLNHFVPVAEGHKPTVEQKIQMLDLVNGIRRENGRELRDYTRILRNIERSRDVAHLASLFVEATGVSDLAVFGEPLIERWCDLDDERVEDLSAEDDKVTAAALGWRGIEGELPVEALNNYRLWRRALDADDPDAVATYEELRAGDRSELSLTALAYRVDGTDEREVLTGIFGPFWSVAQDVMTDTFMDRMEESPHAQDRVKGRLFYGCPAPTDVTLIRQDAVRRITDRELLSMKPKSGRVAISRTDHVCHDSDLTIPAGERHLVSIEVVNDETRTTWHSLAACWCHVVLEDLSFAKALQTQLSLL